MSSPSSSLLSLLSGPPSEMSTPTSQSQSITPSQTQTPKNETEIVLVQAEIKDFYQGAEIYVRGESCTCIRFDYPLVYYRFPNQPLSVEKHRSFVNDRVMFTVNPAIRAQRERTREGLSNQVIYQDIHDDEEREGQHSQVVYEINENAEEPEPDEDDTQTDHYTSTSTSSTSSSSSSSTEESSRTFPEPGKAKNNLLGAFLNRPKKTIFEKQNDQEVKCDARFPSSALIESCTRSTFTFTDKVSSITILNCEDVKINFQSVIGSFEVIKSKGVNVVCHGSATTYQLDQSQDTVIYFPKSIENQPIYWVTSGTSGTQIVAKDDISSVDIHKSRSDNVEPANDITFEIRETRTTEEIEATPDAVQPQWRTIYANDDFTTTPLEREGMDMDDSTTDI